MALEELPGARGELAPGFPVGWLLGEPVSPSNALGRVWGCCYPKRVRLRLGAATKLGK